MSLFSIKQRMYPFSFFVSLLLVVRRVLADSNVVTAAHLIAWSEIEINCIIFRSVERSLHTQASPRRTQ